MKESVKKKIILWFWIILTAPFALIMFLLVLVWLFAEIPSFKELENPNSKLATQLISSDGKVINTFHIENRTYVPYEELAPSLIEAAVATEDVRFYRHCGIDMQSLGRVFVKTLLMRDFSQGGGSTITQQLAKTLYPRVEVKSRIPGVGAVVMVWTKLKEWTTAVKLERNYTKQEIVDMYLNSIFFGSGAYGVKAAAMTFFSKEPKDLSVQESALLVGMVNKPTRYNPQFNPDKALSRRNFVIGRMQQAGYLTCAERDSLCALPIELKYQVLDHNSGLAPYFRDMLRREMSASKPRRADYLHKDEYIADTIRWNQDPFYGWLNKNLKADGSKYNLDKDGLRIYTTIDSRMQKYAEEAVREHLRDDLQPAFGREMRYKRDAPFTNDIDASTISTIMSQARKWSDRYRLQKKAGVSEEEILAQFKVPVKMRVFSWSGKGYVDTVMTPDDSIRYYKSILRSAFVAVEPNTGFVKAYVGGPDYRYFKFDNARQGRRQVGSTIKPFLYTLAMQEGMTPCDKVVNMPQSFTVNHSSWTPRSTDSEEWIGKTVTLKWGLTNSSNNISAYLMKQYGPRAMVQMMHRMGVRSHVDEVVSICVGPADLTPCEMVAAYNTFPSKGVYCDPVFITRIEDSHGNLLAEFSPRRTEAISDRTAYLMANLMEGVVDHGTGKRLKWKYGLEGYIAGKTGTTNDNSDGWFIGYSPQITAGIWVGGEDRSVHFESMALGQGANSALPIWGIFMKKCLADRTLGINLMTPFEAPAGMVIDLSCTGDDIDFEPSDEMQAHNEQPVDEEEEFFN
ncbi:MAG: transglycosylase domain-containing protein [Bacteroidales bacterium]|nr:transglycosylase domain-containing protein [Bacteroidales bacterium]